MVSVTRRFRRSQGFIFVGEDFIYPKNLHIKRGLIERFVEGNKLFFEYSNGPP
jgi:hypothetical protein